MIFPIVQLIVAVILIVLILLQERSAGLSGLFGGGGGSFYQTRRGLERVVFWGTIVAGVIFVGLAIIQLVPLQ